MVIFALAEMLPTSAILLLSMLYAKLLYCVLGRLVSSRLCFSYLFQLVINNRFQCLLKIYVFHGILMGKGSLVRRYIDVDCKLECSHNHEITGKVATLFVPNGKGGKNQINVLGILQFVPHLYTGAS